MASLKEAHIYLDLTKLVMLSLNYLALVHHMIGDTEGSPALSFMFSSASFEAVAQLVRSYLVKTEWGILPAS